MATRVRRGSRPARAEPAPETQLRTACSQCDGARGARRRRDGGRTRSTRVARSEPANAPCRTRSRQSISRCSRPRPEAAAPPAARSRPGEGAEAREATAPAATLGVISVCAGLALASPRCGCSRRCRSRCSTASCSTSAIWCAGPWRRAPQVVIVGIDEASLARVRPLALAAGPAGRADRPSACRRGHRDRPRRRARPARDVGRSPGARGRAGRRSAASRRRRSATWLRDELDDDAQTRRRAARSGRRGAGALLRVRRRPGPALIPATAALPEMTVMLTGGHTLAATPVPQARDQVRVPIPRWRRRRRAPGTSTSRPIRTDSTAGLPIGIRAGDRLVPALGLELLRVYPAERTRKRDHDAGGGHDRTGRRAGPAGRRRRAALARFPRATADGPDGRRRLTSWRQGARRPPRGPHRPGRLHGDGLRRGDDALCRRRRPASSSRRPCSTTCSRSRAFRRPWWLVPAEAVVVVAARRSSSAPRCAGCPGPGGHRPRPRSLRPISGATQTLFTADRARPRRHLRRSRRWSSACSAAPSTARWSRRARSGRSATPSSTT